MDIKNQHNYEYPKIIFDIQKSIYGYPKFNTFFDILKWIMGIYKSFIDIHISVDHIHNFHFKIFVYEMWISINK